MDTNAFTDPFWLHEPAVLFRRDRIFEFNFTDPELTMARRWNASVRAAFYAATLLFLAGAPGVVALGLLFGVAAVNWMMAHAGDVGADVGEADSGRSGSTEPFLGSDVVGTPSAGAGAGASAHTVRTPRAECTHPTPHNPFMNMLLTEYRTDPARSRACATVHRPDIQQEVDDAFHANHLFNDVNDVYNRTQSQREYYTTANTENPNKQKELAEWLYGGAAGRKTHVHADRGLARMRR